MCSRPGRAVLVALLPLLVALACSRRVSPPGTGGAASAPVAAQPAKSSADFEARWQKVTASGANVTYIEDDRGDALMGNVRRASRPRPAAPAEPPAPVQPPSASTSMPDEPRGDEIQRVIRSNLAAVKSCYLAVTRHGQDREGKAIVSFGIGVDGRPTNIQVEAPAFEGTPLPNCLTSQVTFWSFPRSRKGATALSYPFVFVGG